MKKLGIRQQQMLLSLIEYKGWQRRCGWIWKNESFTTGILDSLVRSGYAENIDGYYYAIKTVEGGELPEDKKKAINEALRGQRPKKEVKRPL